MVPVSRPDDTSVIKSVVAACSQIQILALPVKLGPLKTCFAVDTDSAIDVLSADAYAALKRTG